MSLTKERTSDESPFQADLQMVLDVSGVSDRQRAFYVEHHGRGGQRLQQEQPPPQRKCHKGASVIDRNSAVVPQTMRVAHMIREGGSKVRFGYKARITWCDMGAEVIDLFWPGPQAN
jgi:hypothetical protein